MKITFMNQDWQIRNAEPRELVDCYGLCDPKTTTIIIDPDLTRDVWIQTLTHELIHVIEITLHQCLTESQVDVIATGLVHLLKSNPQLLNLYQNESEE